MAFRTGLYNIAFQTPLGSGAGVVYLDDGKVRGGDSFIAYHGTYSENGKEMEALVSTRRHTAGKPSIFGIEGAAVTLKGNISDAGEHITVEGSSPQAPNVTFQAVLSWLTN